MVFLRISPWKGVLRFGKRGKLSLRYIRPYEIVSKVIQLVKVLWKNHEREAAT